MIGTKATGDGDDGDEEDLSDPDVLRMNGSALRFSSGDHNLLLQLPSTNRMELYGADQDGGPGWFAVCGEWWWDRREFVA